MDLSNKSLAFILIASILISTGGTLTALLKLNNLQNTQVTGRATTSTSGTTNVTVNSQLVLTFVVSTINFGGGFANGSMCTLNSTPGSPNLGNCTGFRDANNSLVLENDGNSNVTLNISFDKTAASWIGGTNPAVLYEATNNESNSCPNGTGKFGPGNWTAIPTTASAQQTLCKGSASLGRFGYLDAQDAININLFINVTPDAPPDTGIADLLTITATGDDSDTLDYG